MFIAASQAIEILQKAQQEAERMYIENGDDKAKLIDFTDSNSDNT